MKLEIDNGLLKKVILLKCLGKVSFRQLSFLLCMPSLAMSSGIDMCLGDS